MISLENLKESKHLSNNKNGNTHECKFMMSDYDIVTCDFVYIDIYDVTSTSKVCEIKFGSS